MEAFLHHTDMPLFFIVLFCGKRFSIRGAVIRDIVSFMYTELVWYMPYLSLDKTHFIVLLP